MIKDKIWLISVIVCFLAAVVSLAGSAIGISEHLRCDYSCVFSDCGLQDGPE